MTFISVWHAQKLLIYFFKQGLAITLYDILSVEGGTIHPREGAATYQVSCSPCHHTCATLCMLCRTPTHNGARSESGFSRTRYPCPTCNLQVVFRLVVFRPTEGEIIIGKLSKVPRAMHEP